MKRIQPLLFLVVLSTILVSSIAIPPLAYAQEGAQWSQREMMYLAKSRVITASESWETTIGGTGLRSQTQTITIEVLEGVEKGTRATFNNDYIQVETGDLIYTRHTTGGFDPEMWSVADPYRLNVLLIVTLGVLVLLLAFGGWQGIRGLASLLGSLVLIFYLLIPSIYGGHSPILVSLGVASLIIVVGSYITHGVNRTTTVAMAGMVLTVIVIGVATYLAIDTANLSGFTSEENVYLNFNTDGRINLIGLLFGGIMIGLLGVLYDIAIGQAIAVEELCRAGTQYTRRETYARAMRIGREHIGALINTLAIAYVGTSLPLLLLLQNSDTSIGYILNSEAFATEILRILMGTAGLILAVPITTALATYFLYGRTFGKRTEHSHH